MNLADGKTSEFADELSQLGLGFTNRTLGFRCQLQVYFTCNKTLLICIVCIVLFSSRKSFVFHGILKKQIWLHKFAGSVKVIM